MAIISFAKTYALLFSQVEECFKASGKFMSRKGLMSARHQLRGAAAGESEDV